MSKNNRVSNKTHTQKQLNHYANINNPNNYQYKLKNDNHSNQCNPNFNNKSLRLLSKSEFQYPSCQPDD